MSEKKELKESVKIDDNEWWWWCAHWGNKSVFCPKIQVSSNTFEFFTTKSQIQKRLSFWRENCNHPWWKWFFPKLSFRTKKKIKSTFAPVCVMMDSNMTWRHKGNYKGQKIVEHLDNAYLVSEVPFGLFTLVWELSWKSDFIQGALLDFLVHWLLYPFEFFL